MSVAVNPVPFRFDRDIYPEYARVVREQPFHRPSMPEPPDLTPLLGKARPAWNALRKFLDAQPGTTSEWKFYGEKYGWQLKVTANRRALVYLIPRDGRFTAAVALRDRAILALRESGYPPERLRLIEDARASSEGKPARVEVSGLRDVALVKQLVSAKLTAS